jgi:cytochrome c oxidase subunit 2
MKAGRASTVACLISLAACEGPHHVLDTAGIQAERIYTFWWFILAVATAVFITVIVALLYAVFRARREDPADPEVESAKRRSMTLGIAGAIVGTALILLIFLVVDFATGRAIASLADEEDALSIEVVGHQWWWEVKYEDPVPSRRLTTANEIHIPVGRPVRLRLRSADVIHSFWVPSLHGKRDLIPGHRNFIWLRADRPGVYRGRCAEFCGHQHAKMGLLVVAQPADSFAAWYESQLLPARPPTDSVSARGQEVFLSGPCVMCHTIRGTLAGGKMAPELTHLGSRRTIAAATLPNTRGHLAGWILDPQQVKPGSHMPPNQIAPEDLQALLTYLQGLR